MSSTDFGRIAQAAETITQGGSKKEDDTRFWKLSPDKAGNASATIRFLPRVEGDELPWVKIIDHGFQGKTGRWYIEKSLATIGLDDPVSQLNADLWNNGGDDGKEQARRQKRRTSYYANILVINDPAHPENNGQVRLFKFGKKIMDKIMDKARPTFEDEKPVNVFDFWKGADFKLRMKKVENFANYDSSQFDSPSAIAESDEEILAIAKQQHKLSEFLDPKNYKTYDELKLKLAQVLGESGKGSSSHSHDDDDDVPFENASPRGERSAPAPKVPSKPSSLDDDADLDTDSADYFRSLANG